MKAPATLDEFYHTFSTERRRGEALCRMARSSMSSTSGASERRGRSREACRPDQIRKTRRQLLDCLCGEHPGSADRRAE